MAVRWKDHRGDEREKIRPEIQAIVKTANLVKFR